MSADEVVGDEVHLIFRHLDLAQGVNGRAIEFGHVKAISEDLGLGQHLFHGVDEAVIEIGAHFFDRLLQPLGDSLEEIDQRLLLASFEHRQHDGFSGLIVRADQGDKIGMPFEERDFIHSQEA